MRPLENWDGPSWAQWGHNMFPHILFNMKLLSSTLLNFCKSAHHSFPIFFPPLPAYLVLQNRFVAMSGQRSCAESCPFQRESSQITLQRSLSLPEVDMARA